jgi:hypothetical protein
MPAGVTHFDYTLECKHTAIANVPTAEYDLNTSGAYRLGNKIECPQCGYKLKKIVFEKITRDDKVIEEKTDTRQMQGEVKENVLGDTTVAKAGLDPKHAGVVP